jgi:hypothetical protein
LARYGGFQVDGFVNKETFPVLWNEIVLALPRVQLSDIVTAVVYVDLPDMKDRTESLAKAKSEAKLLGNKPVLKLAMMAVLATMEETNHRDLMVCVVEEEEVNTVMSSVASFLL